MSLKKSTKLLAVREKKRTFVAHLTNQLMYRFADIVLPLSLNQTLTYSVPDSLCDAISVGMRVIVPIGRSKFYTGIVLRLHNDDPRYPDMKPVTTIIDETPTVTTKQLELWQFTAQYYCASLADVYRTALPAALRIESEQDLTLVEEMLDGAKLTRREQEVVDLLRDQKPHRTSEFAPKDMPYLRRLIDHGVIANNERLVDAYRPKRIEEIRLADNFVSADDIEALRLELQRAKKQLEALNAYLAAYKSHDWVVRSSFTKENNLSATIVKQLIDKNIFNCRQRQVDRIDTCSEATGALHALTGAQQTALSDIRRQWQDRQVVLLHGVAASGKTEIYIHLIKECIESGGQALLLLPEVGLTRRLTCELQQYFGASMGVYHSQCTSYERVETYNHQLTDNPFGVIAGVRSAVFLPYKNLQLIIVDDEHDTGYKQSDPSPRYNGRDLAVMLGRLHGAKVLLGTATPSVESYANCHFGKYGLVNLTVPYGASDATRRRTTLTDMQLCRRQRRLKGHYSLEMLEAIKSTIAAGHQVIVFQNRRGFAPYAVCHECGYVPRCPNCDVSLTAHRSTGALTCHYCGHTEPWSELCPQCHRPTITTRGFGTEQVEAELHLLLPDATIGRLDLDTSRSTAAYDRIFADLESGKTDILIGTQMVTKGIDCANVALVCIVNADNLLYHSDFRAHERAFQLLGQAIGRTGRGSIPGQVMIQTSQPTAPIINQIISDNYQAFFASQMTERHAFHYPPYYRVINITIKHVDRQACHKAATHLASRLRLRFANRVLGPDAPAIGRIQNRYIEMIMLKIESSAPISKAKEILTGEINAAKSQRPYNSASYAIDVDPN